MMSAGPGIPPILLFIGIDLGTRDKRCLRATFDPTHHALFTHTQWDFRCLSGHNPVCLIAFPSRLGKRPIVGERKQPCSLTDHLTLIDGGGVSAGASLQPRMSGKYAAILSVATLFLC